MGLASGDEGSAYTGGNERNQTAASDMSESDAVELASDADQTKAESDEDYAPQPQTPNHSTSQKRVDQKKNSARVSGKGSIRKPKGEDTPGHGTEETTRSKSDRRRSQRLSAIGPEVSTGSGRSLRKRPETRINYTE